MYQPHLFAALRLGWGRGHYALVSRTLWLREGGKERVHEKKKLTQRTLPTPYWRPCLSPLGSTHRYGHLVPGEIKMGK